MKIQKFGTISFSLFAMGLALVSPLESRAALALVNADFQDLTGLTAQPGSPGWLQGVPVGWSSATGNLNYNLIDLNSGNYAANIQTLGPAAGFTPLYQSVGLLDSAGDVTLTWNHGSLSPTSGYAAAIYNATPGGNPGTWAALASGSYNEASAFPATLTAFNVSANTPIAIAFWSWAGSPVIDNVALSYRAPMDISLSGASIHENNLVGDVVGSLSTTDLDSGDTHTYSLVAGDGDTDNASFEINGSTLKANIVFDYETKASYSVRVRTTDAGNLTTEKIFTITVTDVSEQTTQQAYLASFGLSGGNLLGTADPDGDGMDNNSEFAFGTSPVNGASRAATLSSGTGTIKITYLQRKSGVTYTVKSLPNLTTAFDSGTTVTPVASSPQPAGLSSDYTQYEASVSTGSARGFLRVRAVAP